MTLIKFPRLTIQPFDDSGVPKGDPIVIQGDQGKGGTITAEISGLAPAAQKLAASDIEYWISQEGVGEVSVDFTLIDIPAEEEAAILGQKVAPSGIIYAGNDTNPPYCGVLMESGDMSNNQAFLGFFRGKFAKDKETANTQDPADKKAPDGDSYTYTVSGCPDPGDQNGEYMAKYIGSDATILQTLRQQVLKAKAPSPTPTPVKIEAPSNLKVAVNADGATITADSTGRSDQYLKITNPTTGAIYAGDKGAASVAVQLSPADYATGQYKAFYDSVAGTSIGSDASDQVDVPAFTVPAPATPPATPGK